MANKRHLDEKWLNDFLDEDPDSIETGSWRHGCTYTYVLEIEGKMWKFILRHAGDEGFSLYGGVDAIEVKPVERTVTDWIPI